MTTRLATEADLASLEAFSHEAAGVCIPEAYWRWRYLGAPTRPSGIVIALDDGRIVGMMTAAAVAFRCGDERLLASGLEHNDILKPYRSSDVYFKLATTVFHELLEGHGIDFCFGISTAEVRDLSMVFMGFEEVGPICKLVRIVNPVPHLRKTWGLPFPRSLGAPLAMLERRRAVRARHELAVRQFDHFADVEDGTWREARQPPLAASRDPALMQWRYVECPLPWYERLQVRRGNRLLGWAVGHTFEEQGVRYGVLDECIGGSASDVGAVADVAIGALLERRVDAIVAWSPPATWLHQALRSRGFTLRPSPRHLIVRSLSDRCPPSVLSSESSWDYTIGDTEYWQFPVQREEDVLA